MRDRNYYRPDRPDLRRKALRGICAALVVAGLLWLAHCAIGCSRREAELSTGRVMTAAELRLALPGFAGDEVFAVVRREALPSLYANFRSVLSDQGLVKWDSRFDCNHFAALFVSLSQTQFAVAAWHSSTKAQTLALAEVWYRPAAGVRGHAVVAAVTDGGLVFLEPQTGAEIQLTAAERGTIYLCKW